MPPSRFLPNQKRSLCPTSQRDRASCHQPGTDYGEPTAPRRNTLMGFSLQCRHRRNGTTGLKSKPAVRPARHRGALPMIPTTCFNCESACGLLAYVDKETRESANSRAILCIPPAADDLRQGPGDDQSDQRSRSHPPSAAACWATRRRQVGDNRLAGGRLSQPHRVRWKKAVVMRWSITSAGRATKATSNGCSRPGALMAITATPTFARRGRVRLRDLAGA